MKQFSEEQIQQAVSQIRDALEGDQAFLDQLQELMEEHAQEAVDSQDGIELARTALERIEMKVHVQGEPS